MNARYFNVFDDDEQEYVAFDATDVERWGTFMYRDGRILSKTNLPTWVEETLYRHPSGHWTLVCERKDENWNQAYATHARRLDDKEAVQWLVEHQYLSPPDQERLGDGPFFTPGVSVDTNGQPGKPKWDEDRRELSLSGTVCKRFRQPAPNQTRILAAFQECDWPSHIDDPIPPSTDVSPRERLADAIRGLNKKCQGIRFERDGTGEGVVWNLQGRGHDDRQD